MSLQWRLTLFFVAIVMLPMTGGGVTLHQSIVDRVIEETEQSRAAALDRATLLYRERAEVAEALLASSFRSGRLVVPRRQVERRLRAMVRDTPLDFAVLTVHKRMIAHWDTAPRFSGAAVRPRRSDIIGSGVGLHAGYYRTEAIPVQVEGKSRARLVGGFWLDERWLRALDGRRAAVALVARNKVIASTREVEEPTQTKLSFGRLHATGKRDQGRGGGPSGGDRGADRGLALVAASPSGFVTEAKRSSLGVLVEVLGLAFVVTGALAYLLARVITKPLKEVAAGATALAAGDLEYEVPVRSGDEIGRLAGSFNFMTGQLRHTITELSSSRDRLQRAILGAGETLRSTHDMDQLLTSILKLACDAVEADAAVLWMPGPTGRDLYPAMAEHLDLAGLHRVLFGTGSIGSAAQSGAPEMFSSSHGSGAANSLPAGMAVPIMSGGDAAAVLALYRRSDARTFSEEDQHTVVFLAEQSGVAMENVVLHEEARRLSLTDGLTGVGNRRYLQMRFRTELAGAARFNHNFSLLLMDLDHFKHVNDTWGHQRGDETLIELSRRVDHELREVDAFVRLGGEEFVCLLSETNVEGALLAAEKIRRLVRAAPFGRPEQDPIKLTVSIGAACFPIHGSSFSTLLQQADKALYSAKQQGRDRIGLAQVPRSDLELAT